MSTLEGVYVQAWLWVPLEELESGGGFPHTLNADECDEHCREAGFHVDPRDDALCIAAARRMYAHDGDIEVDDNAPISRVDDPRECETCGSAKDSPVHMTLAECTAVGKHLTADPGWDCPTPRDHHEFKVTGLLGRFK